MFPALAARKELRVAVRTLIAERPQHRSVRVQSGHMSYASYGVKVTVHFSIRGMTEDPMSGAKAPRPRLVDAISLAE
jgi:hypothetical protein